MIDTAPGRSTVSTPPATIFPAGEFVAGHTLSALVPLHGRIVFSATLRDEATLAVAAQGREAQFPISPGECTPLEAGGCYHDFFLVLNTFQLRDGPQTVQLQVTGSAGSHTKHRVTVDNASSLGRATANAIAGHPARQWIWREGEVDSSHFPVNDGQLAPWFDRDDAVAMAPAVAARSGLDKAEAAALEEFVKRGFCRLPGRLEEGLLERMNADLDAMLANGEIEVTGEDEGDHRVEQIHTRSSAAREIWTLPSVMKFLRAVFQEEVLPCQTLVFIRGSGQDMHQDTIHLTAFPAGYMCGVWIALEDVDEDAGPLFVYPGSHRLPRLYCASVGMSKVLDGDWSEYSRKFLPRLESELAAAGCERETYLPRRGDILVWHENLTHGGSPRNNNALSRRSIVSHYFSEGAAVWYDSSGRCGGTMSLDSGGGRHTFDAVLRVARGVLDGSIRLGSLRALWRMRRP